jgi:outer membrane receptor protein involved in Fe transport
MQSHSARCPIHRLACGLGSLAFTAIAPAQQAPTPSPSSSDTLVLSPFTVVTDKDVGYASGSSGMGGRLNLPLEDTAASISVLNQEFIQDLALTSLTEAAEWAPSTNNVYRDEPTPFNDYQVGIRNLGGSYQASKNFFRYYMNPDAFFTERIDFGRGPNSLVFGDTGVAGAFNTSSKRAKPRASRRIEAQYFGTGGYRAGLDVNQPLNDKLMLRGVALYQDSQGWQDHERTRFDGASLSFTYRPFRRTTIWGEFEYAIRKVTMASGVTDFNSRWDGTTTVSGALAANPATSTGISRITAPRFTFDPASPATGVQNYQNFGMTNGTNLRLAPAGWDAPARWGLPADLRRPLLTIPDYGFNANYDDPNFTNRLRGITLVWEQQYSPHFYSEVGLNRVWSEADNNIHVYRTRDVYIDVNEVLPSGQANPNFRKAYAENWDRGEHQYREPLEGRASLVYLNDTLLLVDVRALLGVNYRFDDFVIRRFRYATTNGTTPDLSNTANLVYFRRYLDQLGAGFSLPPGVIEAKTSQDGGQQWIRRTQKSVNGLISAKWFQSRRLLTSVGYRLENVVNESAAPNYDPVNRLFTDFGVFRTSYDDNIDNLNYNAIYKLTNWASVVAGYAESFEYAGAGRVALDGGSLPLQGGEGWEVGGRFRFLDGKLNASFIYYHNDRTNMSLGGRSTEINDIWVNLGAQYSGRNVPNYTDTESFRARGREFEVVANPTRNLTLSANYSRGTAIQTEGYAATRAYYEANLATWQAEAAKLTDPTAATRVQSNIASIKSIVEGYTEGRVRPDNYKYTANLAARYSFSAGRLKGLAVGGGANLRGARLIGNENGRPFDYLWGGGYTLVSAYASYSFKLRDGTLRLQANVSNLLDRQSPALGNGSFTNVTYMTTAGTTATVYVPRWYTVEAPRTVRVTAAYSF